MSLNNLAIGIALGVPGLDFGLDRNETREHNKAVRVQGTERGAQAPVRDKATGGYIRHPHGSRIEDLPLP